VTGSVLDAGPAQFSQTGCFIVFEGGDGNGKTTQTGLLCDWLAETGRTHLRTFEPGDSRPGQQIRSIVLDPSTGDLSSKAEALLYAADKAQHVQQVVWPALERGQIVVSDRYVDSMLAYQGAGRVLAVSEVAAVARWATGNLRPNLVVLLDGDPAELGARLASRDRIESAGNALHDAAREHFRTLAACDPGHYLVLDALDRPESIAAAVRDRVANLLESETNHSAPCVQD
jgi:dTMP kinase